MADIAHATGVPTNIFSFGSDGWYERDGVGILITPVVSGAAYTIDSITVAFSHRQISYVDTGHGDVTTISCYIADDVVLGSSGLPVSLANADNTILSTAVTEYAYGTWDGTYSLHTFNFTGCPALSGQNWIVISQTATDGNNGWTFSCGWIAGTGSASERDGVSTGATRIRADVTDDEGDWQDFVSMTHYVDVEGAFLLPEKAITPGPTNANEAVELDQEDLTWVDGGLGEANEATHFSVYYGTTSGALTLVSSGQAAGVASNLFTVWGIGDGSPYDYEVTRYWRIDSTNGAGTTTGDEWMFTTLSEGYVPPYPPPRPDPYDPDVGGGGSYATNLLVIGHKVLYYRET